MAFRRRYNLPSTDPRFLDATTEEIITDYWAHYYSEHKANEEFEDEDFNRDEIEQMAASGDWEEVFKL